MYFSRLTNQFTIIFAPILDNFGTLFEILGERFYFNLSIRISIYYKRRGDNSGKGFGERLFLIGFFLSCSWLACFDLIFQQLTGLCPIEECFW